MNVSGTMSTRKTKLITPLVPACLAAVLLMSWAGCGPGEKTPTITERLRQEVGPKVARFLLMGQRAYENGNYNLALALTDSVEAIEPKLADLHYLRGAVYTQLNRLDIANAAYRTVLELDPEYVGARFNLGMLESRRGHLRDAIAWMQQEMEIEETSNLQLELGRAYATLGEPDSAETAYRRSIELDDSNATAHMWLGQLYEELGEMDKALEQTMIGLELRPRDLDYQYVAGSLLLRMGQPERAKEYLEPVAEERPWHHGALVNMGQALMRLGRQEDAEPYFAQADTAQQLQQKIMEAEREINRDPDILSNWIELGGLLRQSGDYEKAIEAFNVAVTLDPWNMHLQNNLALLYMEDGQLDVAIRRYRAILTVDSSLADVWLNLGAAYANAGNEEAARDAWRRVQELEPGHPAARDYLAQISKINHTR